MFITIKDFSGIAPRYGPSTLMPTQAQIAQDVWLQGNQIQGWKNPVQVYALQTPNVQGVYKLIKPNTNLLDVDEFVWLEFNCDVNVVPGPQGDTTDFRVYYTGASFAPRKTNWSLGTGNGGSLPPYPRAYQEMGVPSPILPPTLVTTTGVVPNEVRAYVYTYVNVFGNVQEESAPSPPCLIETFATGATVTISALSPAPSGNYNIKYINIYRTVSGSSTSAIYQFVAQLPITQTSFTDNLTVVQLGAGIVSTYYTPPPTGLQGLISLPNGILAGFVGNEVWFCEPYTPHAWPVTYMQTVGAPIVGLGVFGTTLFVGTIKNPVLMTGTYPSLMTQEVLPILHPCVSKRSIVSDQFGVTYASPFGLVAIGPGVQDIITSQLVTVNEWLPINPASLISTMYNNLYIGFYQNGTNNSVILARADTPPLINYTFDATAVFSDQITGDLFVVSGSDNAIYQLNANNINTTTYTWTSKKFIMSEPVSFAAFRVDADYDYQAAAAANNVAIQALIVANTATWATYSGKSLLGDLDEVVLDTYTVDGTVLSDTPESYESRYITVSIYGDGNLVLSTNVTSKEPVRMPAAQKYYSWEIKFVGNCPLRAFHMSTNMGELRQVQ